MSKTKENILSNLKLFSTIFLYCFMVVLGIYLVSLGVDTNNLIFSDIYLKCKSVFCYSLGISLVSYVVLKFILYVITD